MNHFNTTPPTVDHKHGAAFERIFEDFQYWTSFKIGDVLIQRKVLWNFEEPDISGNEISISNICPIPKKYIIVFIDKHKIPWVRQIRMTGGLHRAVEPLTNAYHPTNLNYRHHSWEIDPEQLDAILLGIKYDPRAQYKKFRKDNPQYARKSKD